MSRSSIITKPSLISDDEVDDDITIMAPPGGFKLPAFHPGVTLAEQVKELGLTAHALALKLRVPANRISGIMNGTRSVTAETALRLARYFGTSAEFWLGLQAAYDLYVAEQKFGNKIIADIAAREGL